MAFRLALAWAARLYDAGDIAGIAVGAVGAKVLHATYTALLRTGMGAAAGELLTAFAGKVGIDASRLARLHTATAKFEAITARLEAVGGWSAGGVIGSSPKGEAVKIAQIVLPKHIIELSEANIKNSGITVLGSYPGNIDKAIGNDARYFNILSAWNTLTESQRWASNAHFLNVIASKGDRVYLSTNVKNICECTSLRREVDYITKRKGYRISKNSMSLYK